MYFAKDAGYPLQHFTFADQHNIRHVYCVYVSVGKMCQGTKGIRTLPQRPGAAAHVTFDTATDNINNPREIIVFHDSQAYPAYHILYTL